jgi:hypothetical protein
VVVESDRRAPLLLPFEVLRKRHYGDTVITIHRHIESQRTNDEQGQR